MYGAFAFATSLLFTVSVFGQTPVISDGGIVNSVTQDRSQAVAPGSIVSIFGSELAASSAAADSVPLSTSIAAVSVTFNAVRAPIRQISPTVISVQVPWETATSGAVNVVVTRNGVASAAKPVNVAQVSPGIYAINNLGLTNLALAMNSDGTLAQAVGAVPGLNSHPAVIGDTVMILATGLGPVDSPIANGVTSSDSVRNVTNPPQVMLKGITAPVVSATLATDLVGAYQVLITVPDAAPSGNAVPLQMQVGDVASPTTTTMAVGAI